MTQIYSIPITTFKRPNGEQVAETLDTRRSEVYLHAKGLIDRGYKFEFEVLSSGHGHLELVGDYDGEETGLTGRIVRGDDPERMTKLEDWILAIDPEHFE